jgi:hypothetical protein
MPAMRRSAQLTRLLLAAAALALLAACAAPPVVPTATPAPTSTPTLNAGVLARLATLRGLVLAGLQPGWLHVQERLTYDIDQPNRGTLPTGLPIPLDQTVERWLRLDETGQVAESISTLSTAGGTLLLATRFQNGMVWDSATQERRPQAPPKLGYLDYGFGENASAFTELGLTIHERALTHEGAEAVEFTVDNVFERPARYVDFTQPVSAMTTRAVFDPVSGHIRLLEQRATLADGTQRLMAREALTVTREEPPESLRALLDQP